MQTQDMRITFSANKSLSKLCPINMVSALNMFNRTAWTSRRVILVFSRSSSVTPENLQCKSREEGFLHQRNTSRPKKKFQLLGSSAHWSFNKFFQKFLLSS